MKTVIGSPTDRLLTYSLIASLALTLVSSILYATRGWDDGAGAVFHIVGGTLGALVVLRLVTFLDRSPVLAAVTLLIGMVGAAGVVGYGFNTIGVSLGATDLVDATGAATIIKPLGLCWPIALLLLGIGLLRAKLVPLGYSAAIIVAAVAFPVSRIANIGWLAVVVDIALLVSLSAVTVRLAKTPHGGDIPAGAVGTAVGR